MRRTLAAVVTAGPDATGRFDADVAVANCYVVGMYWREGAWPQLADVARMALRTARDYLEANGGAPEALELLVGEQLFKEDGDADQAG